jgi:hypothetical protein
MASFDRDASPASPKPAATFVSARVGPSLYAATLFISALLLFSIQPMFTKMILPRLGGAPAVWSVAIVFFQAALLLGYVYAHLLTRMMRPLHATFVHAAALTAGSIVLPIGIARGVGTPPENGLLLWLFVLMVASIGPPVAALAASSPLVQSWLAATDHERARNPYVLYAASNFGSFAGLLAYPFVVEPLLTLQVQCWLWSFGYTILAVLITATGMFAACQSQQNMQHATPAQLKPTFKDRVAWMVLAAIPSGLVVAVTAYITTDVAAAPFLWVLPLGLYLLTFVALFRDRPWISDATVTRLVPLAVAPLAVSMLGEAKAFWIVVIGVNLVAFLLLSLLCHGKLYRRRPERTWLTEFYICISLGGTIGGLFAGIIAPNLFKDIYEYPVLVAAALLVMPGILADRWRFLRQTGPALVIVAAIAIARLSYDVRFPFSAILFQVTLIGLVALMLMQRRRPAPFFGLVLITFIMTALWPSDGSQRVETLRSFFGVHRIFATADGRYHLLFNGTTLHGAEQVRAADGTKVVGTPEPLTYYYFGGPLSESITAARTAQGGLKNVAVIGLGTGSLACHSKSGEHWSFFEIDPVVVRIARDPDLFRFISTCGQNSPVILGDARLMLAASTELYDLIVLDAFSSDAIPVHLLTREALAGYLSRLSLHGTLVYHLSSRNLDLLPVVAAAAAAEGLAIIAKGDNRAEKLFVDYKANALVAVVARNASDLASLHQQPGWSSIITAQVLPWTDNYSNVLGALLRQELFIP